MGIGSKRVMGLGIPLMQVLSLQQFRGVLAHEFGHYYSGDVSLGPWIFVTRSAILRTVMNLSQDGSSLLSKPFEWYFKLFLRITQSISRQQEFTADALAAKIAGPRAMIDGLKVVHSSGHAFNAYWENEYVPVLNGGYRAPLAEGFRQFYQSPKISTALQDVLQRELESGVADPYDSHPALRDRIAALEQLPELPMPSDDPPFISAVRNLDQLEVMSIEHLAAAVKASMPESIHWGNVTDKVWLPFWRRNLSALQPQLTGIIVRDLGAILTDPEQLVSYIGVPFDPQVPQEVRVQYGCNLMQFALTLALHRAGWSLHTPVGCAVVAAVGDRQVEPFTLIGELFDQKITSHEFLAQCTAAGIADLSLDPPLEEKYG